jgi:hypothetical protein
MLPSDKNLYIAVDRHARLQDEWLVLKRRSWALKYKGLSAHEQLETLDCQIADARKQVDRAKYRVQIELDKLMDAYRYWLTQKAG